MVCVGFELNFKQINGGFEERKAAIIYFATKPNAFATYGFLMIWALTFIYLFSEKMEIPSLANLKKDLSYLSEKDLIMLITDLAKFSRDNKAFLYFKLNERDQPNLFVDSVKEELDEAFQTANTKNYHLAKKAAQGIRRKLNKALKLNKNKADQAELILYFCEMMKKYSYLSFRHPVITNLYEVQIGKAKKLISTLHEDLQSDFDYRLEELE